MWYVLHIIVWTVNCVLLCLPTGKTELAQAEKAKIITQEVLRLQKDGTAPALITEVLSKGGVDDIRTFKALTKLAQKKTLKREDMYTLFSPYNHTEQGHVISMYFDLRGADKKASVRNSFSQLVKNPGLMEASPALFYDEAYRFSMEK